MRNRHRLPYKVRDIKAIQYYVKPIIDYFADEHSFKTGKNWPDSGELPMLVLWLGPCAWNY